MLNSLLIAKFAGVVFLVFLIALITGLVKPSIVLPFIKVPKRWKVIVVHGLLMICLPSAIIFIALVKSDREDAASDAEARRLTSERMALIQEELKKLSSCSDRESVNSVFEAFDPRMKVLGIDHKLKKVTNQKDDDNVYFIDSDTNQSWWGFRHMLETKPEEAKLFKSSSWCPSHFEISIHEKLSNQTKWNKDFNWIVMYKPNDIKKQASPSSKDRLIKVIQLNQYNFLPPEFTMGDEKMKDAPDLEIK